VPLSPHGGAPVVNGRGRGSAGSRGAGGISRGYLPRTSFKSNNSEVCAVAPFDFISFNTAAATQVEENY
jgi:hypothetical protein